MSGSGRKRMSPVASGLVIAGIVFAVTLAVGGLALVGAFVLAAVAMNNWASNK